LNGLRTYRTCWLIHNQSTEPILRTDFVVVVALGVEVERGLHLRVPKHLLHSLRINLPLVHQLIAKAVAEIVESEAVSVWDLQRQRRLQLSASDSVEQRRADWN
jgi:hypothetical protein